jgi:catechol 2,3-dioxygenase-like lactoylglutathione lyase family enzyme
MKLNYVIEFVADMDRGVKFYRDVLGLSLKFQSPGWSEFSTGETSLGLHPGSEKNPAGSIELGFNVTNLEKFHQEMTKFIDSEGRRCSVAEQTANAANQ